VLYVRIVAGVAAFAISFFVTLFLIDHGNPGPGETRSGGPCEGPRTVLKRPFGTEIGFAVQADLSQFKDFADTNEFPAHSKLVLCENSELLGPPHSLHNDIRMKGFGRYSHWNEYLLFSSSDNSNPQTNMREYTVRIVHEPPKGR
jgi:hypothetical protein